MNQYTLKLDFSSLDKSETGAWMSEFLDMVEDAFTDSDHRTRLLGNLLVLARYTNIIRQGLAKGGRKISDGLECAMNLLWEYLEGNAEPADFQDFANDYYACLEAYNVGDIHTDAPKEFYNKYFANAEPEAYELLAVEWSSGLLLQIVSIEGGHVDYDEFEEWEEIDFYGIDIMLNLLEDACIELTGTPLPSGRTKDLETAMEQVRQTPLFQEIIKNVQGDLQVAHDAIPQQYGALRNEYENDTIIPVEYAEKLLEY